MDLNSEIKQSYLILCTADALKVTSHSYVVPRAERFTQATVDSCVVTIAQGFTAGHM